MVGYIYVITNKINGKQYVGKTYLNIEKRFKYHINDSKRERNKNRPLYKAIKKYGKDNFYIRLLEECDNPEEREIYWIKVLNTYKKGYNVTFGGDGKTSFPYSDEKVIKKYLELGTVEKTARAFSCDIGTIRKKLYINNIKIESSSSHSKRNLSKSVVFFNSLENKNVIFKSTMDAARYIKQLKNTNATLIHIGTNISRCCDNNRKSAYGFVWRWL